MIRKISLSVLALGLAAGATGQTFSGNTGRAQVTKVCNAVANWQIANQASVKHPVLDWTNGALYRGMVEWGKTSNQPAYIDFVEAIGQANDWNMWHRARGMGYHADDICVGQAFIEIYRLRGDENALRPAMERAFWIASHPSKAPLLKTDPVGKDERWSWCDALFMAPPVYAALYSITGEKIYLDYMEAEYRECTDSLYDRQEHLYYRDCIRIPLREPNGAKQFWGRGNGWVFGGIPLIIENLPPNHPSRGYYISIFQEMADKLIELQDENGAWHASLLDPVAYPLPENSASAFFCYGFAWGIRNGYLAPRKFTPALEKGWKSLTSGVHPDGKLGYVQPVGAAPKASGADATDVYGVGAFLLAGSELYRLNK